MNTTCTLPELAEYLNKLLDCNALELIFRSDKDSAALYIPYMMNDALENYLPEPGLKFLKKLPPRENMRLFSIKKMMK